MLPITIFILLVVFYSIGYMENGSIVVRRWKDISGALAGMLMTSVVLFFVWLVVAA